MNSYKSDSLIIRSMAKSDIEKFVEEFAAQKWH